MKKQSENKKDKLKRKKDILSDESNGSKDNDNETNNKRKIIEISDNTIDNIISKNGKTKIEIYVKELNENIIYTYKNKAKNKYYYQCSKRPKCRGKGVFIIDKKEFYITNNCNENINHK